MTLFTESSLQMIFRRASWCSSLRRARKSGTRCSIVLFCRQGKVSGRRARGSAGKWQSADAGAGGEDRHLAAHKAQGTRHRRHSTVQMEYGQTIALRRGDCGEAPRHRTFPT